MFSTKTSKRISLLKSFLVSTTIVFGFFIVFFLANPMPVAAMFSSFDITFAFLLLFFGNILSDYISLVQTRTFLEISKKVDQWPHLFLLILTDILMTLLISLFVFSFFTTLSLFVFSDLTPDTEKLIVERGKPFKYNKNENGDPAIDPMDVFNVGSINLK